MSYISRSSTSFFFFFLTMRSEEKLPLLSARVREATILQYAQGKVAILKLTWSILFSDLSQRNFFTEVEERKYLSSAPANFIGVCMCVCMEGRGKLRSIGLQPH